MLRFTAWTIKHVAELPRVQMYQKFDDLRIICPKRLTQRTDPTARMGRTFT